MVAEPKPHQTGRKRQNVAKTGNDWDYYYDSYYASAQFLAPRLVPPLKRPRLMGATPVRAAVKGAAQHKQASPPPSSPLPLGQLKVYSNPDILICGNCREMFTELQELVEHKKTYCKLRFTCKCTTINGAYAKSPGHDTAALLCVQCKDSFLSAWDLMEHVQAAHMLNIYELGSTKSARLSPALETTPPVSPNGKEDDKSVGDQDEVMTSPVDMEDELLEVESTAQACIMHALRIDSSSSMMGDGDHIMKPLTNGELKAQE